MDSNNKVSYEQVREAVLETMKAEVNLTTESSKCHREMVWDILGLASVKQESVHGTCQSLEDAPTAAGIFYQLRQGWLARENFSQLEQKLNELLVAHLPDGIRGKRHEIAFDLTEIPYHGQAQECRDEVRRGKAKAGTTHFHVYGSAYILLAQQQTGYGRCCLLASRPIGVAYLRATLSAVSYSGDRG